MYIILCVYIIYIYIFINSSQSLQAGCCDDGSKLDIVFGRQPADVHLYFHFPGSHANEKVTFAHYSLLVPISKMSACKPKQRLCLAESVASFANRLL